MVDWALNKPQNPTLIFTPNNSKTDRSCNYAVCCFHVWLFIVNQELLSHIKNLSSNSLRPVVKVISYFLSIYVANIVLTFVFENQTNSCYSLLHESLTMTESYDDWRLFFTLPPSISTLVNFREKKIIMSTNN